MCLLDVTALCLLNTPGRWPVIQNSHSWGIGKTFYLVTMLSTCLPQSNLWPPSPANVLKLQLLCLTHQPLPDCDSGLCWPGSSSTVESNLGQEEPVHTWRTYLPFCLWNRVLATLCMEEKGSKDEWVVVSTSNLFPRESHVSKCKSNAFVVLKMYFVANWERN